MVGQVREGGRPCVTGLRSKRLNGRETLPLGQRAGGTLTGAVQQPQPSARPLPTLLARPNILRAKAESDIDNSAARNKRNRAAAPATLAGGRACSPQPPSCAASLTHPIADQMAFRDSLAKLRKVP